MAYYKDNGDGTYDVESGDGSIVRVARTPQIDAMMTAYNKDTGAATGSGMDTGMPAEVAPAETPLIKPGILDAMGQSPIDAAAAEYGGWVPPAVAAAATTPAAMSTASSAAAMPSIADTTGVGTVLRPGGLPGQDNSQNGEAAPKPQVANSGGPLPTMIETIRNDGSSQKIVDPKILAQMDANIARVPKILADQGAVNEKIKNDEATKFNAQAANRAQQETIRTQAADAAKQQYNDYNANVSKMLADYEKTEIKPAGLFEGGAGANIMAGIAIALGAVGGALTGSNQNAALQVIDKAIDRDLEAQKANLGKKREAINVLGIRYQAARQAGMDDVSAKLAAKADAYDQIGLYFDAKKASLEAPQAKQQAELMAIKYQDEALKTRAELTSRTVTGNTQKITKVDTSKLIAPIEFTEKQTHEITDMQGRLRFVKMMREADEMNKGGVLQDRWKDFALRWGLSSDSDYQQYLTNKQEFAAKYVESLTGAGVGEKEREILADIVPKQNESSAAIEGKLRNLEKGAYGTLNSYEQNYGLQPGMRTKNGFIWQEWRPTDQRAAAAGGKKVN